MSVVIVLGVLGQALNLELPKLTLEASTLEKAHFTHDEAVVALKRYFAGEKTHAIYGSAGVNTWRLYAMLNGTEHPLARSEFLDWLKQENHSLYLRLKHERRWRRGAKLISKQPGLFDLN